MIIKNDNKYNFVSIFNPKTGSYLRTGILDENGIDTGVDPFMASFPELLDIGIMQTCMCAGKCNVDCYQKAISRTGPNMSIENFEKIMKQSKGKLFQCALGGAGDVDTHENFEEIVKMCRDYNIVPNFTTSGIMMNKKKAEICKKYCGAVAVSQHSKLKKMIVWKYKDGMTEEELKEEYNPYIENFENIHTIYLNHSWYLTNEVIDSKDKCFRILYVEDESSYTYKAIECLLRENVKTSIHFVLGKSSIDEAIFRVKNNAFPQGINAVVFLLYKPVGLGRKENVLDVNNIKVKEFFKAVDKCNTTFKIGFDSCSCPGLVNFTKNINLDSVDFCEGGRFSAYIDANMNMMPCSFANQDPSWSMSLNEYSIQEIWDSKIFDKFRYPLKNSCKKCPNQKVCAGGCPLVNEITLCNSKNRDFQGG